MANVRTDDADLRPIYRPAFYESNNGNQWEIVAKLDKLLSSFDNANINYNKERYVHDTDKFAAAIKLLRKMITVEQIRSMDLYEDHEREIDTDLRVVYNIKFINECQKEKLYVDHRANILDMVTCTTRNDKRRIVAMNYYNITTALNINFNKFDKSYGNISDGNSDRCDCCRCKECRRNSYYYRDGYFGRDGCAHRDGFVTHRDKSYPCDCDDCADVNIIAVYAFPIWITMINDIIGEPFVNDDLSYTLGDMLRVINDKLKNVGANKNNDHRDKAN